MRRKLRGAVLIGLVLLLGPQQSVTAMLRASFDLDGSTWRANYIVIAKTSPEDGVFFR